MRPATSLDAISHHRVIATGREFPSRSATISTKENLEDVASQSSVSLNSPARNHVTKPFPNASSESDLSRYRTRLKDRKSPSLSNLTAEGMKHKFSFQDPNAAKGLFPNSKGHQKIDKVAHVGQV
ncbi:putative potassium voltage-gated channel subfamily H member 2 isoform X4, partial [Penaeus vannamei]